MKSLDSLDPTRIDEVSPAWWSAVFGAVVAGAIVFPAHRVGAAVAAGLATLAIALYELPCCAGCAGCGGTSVTGTGATTSTTSPELGVMTSAGDLMPPPPGVDPDAMMAAAAVAQQNGAGCHS